jgi:thioredoxin-dependent peroxiredoxin
MPLIDPGKKAPAFSLKDQQGKTHRLADYAGRPVVLFFYPKDDTPGCTKEACAFRDNLPKFKTGKAVVLGISILDEASKARFAAKHDLTFPLLADADHAMADTYGVWQKKSLYGRNFMGIARTTYLVGGDGKVLKRWDNVKVDGHADAVLAAVDAIASKP